MPKMRDLQAVDADYPLAGPNQKTLVQPLQVPADVLFACLEDGPAWKEWLGIEVVWTSPEPRGIGSTRTVSLNGQMIDEYFFTWDQDQAMGFRFDRCTLPVTAFAEHYECAPTSESTCELRWSYAYAWDAPLAAISGPVFAQAFAFNSRRALKKLAALLQSEPQRWA